MCTGRVDLAFMLRAFQDGADGVIIGGCWPGECHYVTEGNYDALANVYLCRKLLEQVGMNPARVRIEWVGASEGNRFAEVMSDFAAMLRELGPCDQPGEGKASRRLAALSRMVPYLRLVQSFKLRAPEKSVEAYEEFFQSEEVDRFVRDLIADKMAASEILMLLEESPLATGEISERLGLDPSEVSRHMKFSSRQGLVRYDLDRKRYALAGTR